MSRPYQHARPPAKPVKPGAASLLDRARLWAAAKTGCGGCNAVRSAAGVVIGRPR